MNAAILVLTTLSALLGPASPAPPASETVTMDQSAETTAASTECGPADPLAALEQADDTAVCASTQGDELDPLAGVDSFNARPSAKPPKPLGFCRCGCGIRCSTSADCGGGSCDKFITCC